MTNKNKAQLIVFKSLMDEVVKKYLNGAATRLFGECRQKDFDRISEEVTKLANETGEYESIGASTIKRYKQMYLGNTKLNYGKFTMNSLAFYIDFESYETYLDSIKNFLGYDLYETKDLITYKVSEDKEDGKISFEKILKFGREELQEHIHTFSVHVQKNDKDNESYFWLGVLLMERKRFDAATTCFEKALELNPTENEYYYNLALSKFKGKRPFRLHFNEIIEILEDVDSAISFNKKKMKFYDLKVFIQEDFFKRRGLSIPKDEIEYYPENDINIDLTEQKRLCRLLNIKYEDLLSTKKNNNHKKYNNDIKW